jgi:hypothetical protein
MGYMGLPEREKSGAMAMMIHQWDTPDLMTGHTLTLKTRRTSSEMAVGFDLSSYSKKKSYGYIVINIKYLIQFYIP